VLHVQVTGAVEPVLVGLDRQRSYQSQAARHVGEDPHDMGAPFDLLVQALEHVGRFHVFVMGERQPVVEPAPAKAGVSVSSILSSAQSHSFGYLACHLESQTAMSRRTSARSRRS
jgi:hypothetical protein